MKFGVKMAVTMAVCSIIAMLAPHDATASPPPPPQAWERFLDAERVVLAKVIDPNPPVAKVQIVTIYKGDKLPDTIDINIQRSHWDGGPYPDLYRGDRVIVYLKQTPDKVLELLRKKAADNPAMHFDAPTTKPGVYDILYQYEPFMGNSLVVVLAKNQADLDLVTFLSSIYQAKGDDARYKLIQDELIKDSSLVPTFPVLFVKQRYSFVGYVSDAQSPKTWLPVDGDAVPESFSNAARDYLTKHAAALADNQYLLQWLVQVIAQRYDNAAEKFLFDIVRNGPLSSAATVADSLRRTALKGNPEAQQTLLCIMTRRLQESLALITERDKSANRTARFEREWPAQRFMISVSRLAVDLKSRDEAIVKAVMTWARETPWLQQQNTGPAVDRASDGMRGSPWVWQRSARNAVEALCGTNAVALLGGISTSNAPAAAARENEIEVFQGYTAMTPDEESCVELKDMFPFNENLSSGKKRKIALVIWKMMVGDENDYRDRNDGKYYRLELCIESHYACILNDKNRLEPINTSWIKGRSIPGFQDACRDRKPADLEKLKSVFTNLTRYGVAPGSPTRNGYAVLRFASPISAKIDPTFPDTKECSVNDSYAVSEVFVKVHEAWNSAGGWGPFIYGGPMQYYQIDSAGTNYVAVPTLSGGRTLLDVRWMGRSLSVDDLSLDAFPEQDKLLDDFVALYPDKDRFGHP